MKKLLICLLLIPSLAYSATRNIVPRGTGEGWIGLSTKTWAGVYADQFFGDGAQLTNVVSTGTAFGGDVSGTYDDITIVSVPTGSVDLSTVTTALAGKLTSPATFYVVKQTDYMVAPASFTYLAPTGDGSNLTGVIQSTATGNYLFRVATATYLATAPGNCSAGEFISGLTADGTKTCAAPAGGGDVVLASTQTFTGSNTFAGSVTVSSFTATGNTAFTGAASTMTVAGWIDIGLQDVSTTCNAASSCAATCPAGKAVLSCYWIKDAATMQSMYINTGEQKCTVTVAGGTANIITYARCARVK